MASRSATTCPGGTTIPVRPARLTKVVPVPISLEIIGLPYIAPSSRETPKASERKCEGNTTPWQSVSSAALSASDTWPRKMHIAQPQSRGLRPQRGFDFAGAGDHDRVFQPLCGLQQHMQALVVAQHADKQEELPAHARAPLRQTLRVGLRIGRAIQSDRDHADLVGEFLQHRAGRQIIGRGCDNAIHAAQKTLL